MANGALQAPPPVIGGVSPGVGLAQGSFDALGNMTGLLKDLAFFNLAQKKQQEAFQQEAGLRQTLQQQQQQGQKDILGQQQDFSSGQDKLQRDFLAEQNRLDRLAREKLAKIQSDNDEDLFDTLFKGSTISGVLGLDPKDPTIFEAIGKKNYDLIKSELTKQQAIEQSIQPLLTNKDQQRQVFGDTLSSKESQELLDLYEASLQAPSNYGPKLKQRIAEIRSEKQKRASEPGMLDALFKLNVADSLFANSQYPSSALEALATGNPIK